MRVLLGFARLMVFVFVVLVMLACNEVVQHYEPIQTYEPIQVYGPTEPIQVYEPSPNFGEEAGDGKVATPLPPGTYRLEYSDGREMLQEDVMYTEDGRVFVKHGDDWVEQNAIGTHGSYSQAEYQELIERKCSQVDCSQKPNVDGVFNPTQ